MRRVVGSLLLALPMSGAGLAAVWAGLILRGESFLPFSTEHQDKYWYIAPWLPQLPGFVACSMLWLVGGVCLLLGLSFLGQFWEVSGATLLGVWIIAHGAGVGLVVTVIQIAHPNPAALWADMRSTLTLTLSGLSLGWKLYFILFWGAVAGSFVVVLRKQELWKPAGSGGPKLSAGGQTRG